MILSFNKPQDALSWAKAVGKVKQMTTLAKYEVQVSQSVVPSAKIRGFFMLVIVTIRCN